MVCDGVVGVQRGHHQVAGLGGGQRGRDGLQIAQLADQHDIWILAQDVLERRREAVGVGAHLALVDRRAVALVHVLDRVFDRDDVAGAACD